MSKTFKNIRIPYPTEGIIRTAQLNDTIAPENSVQIAVNMNFDRVGAIISRTGIQDLNSTGLSGNLHYFGTWNPLPGGLIPKLLGQAGTGANAFKQIYSWNRTSNTWVLVRTLVQDVPARFSQFLGVTWMVNGSQGDPVQFFNGTTFTTTFGTLSVPPGFPRGDFIHAGFEGRVWVADAMLDVVYFTDIVQFTPPASYTLTFDITKNFIKNFSPQDGESITGFFRVPRALLVFKQNHIYRVYGAYSVDNYPAYNVGTFSQESIVQTKDGIYFHHSSGFYKFNYDGQPTEISRKVIDFVKAIEKARYREIRGVYDGFDAIEWIVGAVTVEGATFRNCVMRYTISTQLWTIYDYAASSLLALIRFDDGTEIRSFVSTIVSQFGVIDSGNNDFGAPFYIEIIDRWRSFTDMYAKAKSISGLNVYTENGAGLRLEYQTEKSPPNVWKYLDTVTDQYDALFPNATTDDFANVRLRLAGNTSGTQIIYHGMEILSIQDKGFEQN